jgi:hypothetical protein
MLGDYAPQDWGIADKTEWVAEQPLEGEARMPALEGRDIVGFSENIDFAIKLAPGKPPQAQQWTDESGRPVKFNPSTKSWYHIDQSAKKDLQKKLNQQSQPPRGEREKQQETQKRKTTHPEVEQTSKSTAPQAPVAEESPRVSETQKENVERSQKELKKNTSVESYRGSEVFNKPTLFTNEQFVSNPIHPTVKDARFTDIKAELLNSELFPEGVNFPPAYLDLLSQLAVTKAKGIDGPPLSDYISGAGAGQPMSQVGELMTMASTTMSNEQAERFFEIMEKAAAKGSVVDPSWIVAARRNRVAINRAITNNLGGGQVVAASWDVPSEVEELGLNYEDKGFSTDAFFRVKRNDGSEVVLEVSLKKDKNVFFLNSGAATLAEQSIKAMPEDSPVRRQLQALDDKLQQLKDKYNKGANFTKALPRIGARMSNEQKKELTEARKAYEELSQKRQKFLKENTSEYNSDVYMEGLVENVYQPMAKELLQNPEALQALQQISNSGGVDLNKYIKGLKASSLEDALNIVANTSPDQSGEAHKKLLAKVLNAVNSSGSNNETLNKYAKELESRYRKYQKGLADELSRPSSLRTAVIGNIRKEFPLKAVMNGEEVMAIGDASFDLKTAERVFGTTDIEEINQRLTVKTDSLGSPMLVYTAGQEGREIAIATILVRQRGIGYASMGFEAGLHPSFYDELRTANIEENLNGVERVRYTKAEAKKGPRDETRHLPENMTMGEKKKPTYEDYMEILKAKRAASTSNAEGRGANYADSMVFYKGKALGRCPAGTTRAGKTCVPGASATPKGPGYKQTDLGGLSPAQVQALSKAQSTEDIIKAHKKSNNK